MADDFQAATQRALVTVRGQMLATAEQLNQEVVKRDRPSSVVRSIDGAIAVADTAYTFYQVARLAQSALSNRAPSRIEYRYSYMQEIVDFALSTLRALSPVGSGGDPHPGLYRDSHTVFLNGRVASDVSAWRDGDQINISNPVPYSRKIEIGTARMSVPGHVYETAAQLVDARYGNQASTKFTFMPVVFGDNRAAAAFSRAVRPRRRRLSTKALNDWLSRQPALQIRSR